MSLIKRLFFLIQNVFQYKYEDHVEKCQQFLMELIF